MYTLIISLIILASILLILVVLVQNPKGGGIASNFSSGNNIMGVKRTTDFIEKLTWGLAIAIIVLSISTSAFMGTTGGDDVPESQMQEKIDDAPVAPVTPVNPGGQNAPAGGGQQPVQQPTQ